MHIYEFQGTEVNDAYASPSLSIISIDGGSILCSSTVNGNTGTGAQWGKEDDPMDFEW